MMANLSFAQTPGLDPWGSGISYSGVNTVAQTTGLSQNDPRVVAVGIIRVFLGLLGLLAVILIIYAGFVWMNSNGDEKKIESAKNILKNAIIGLLIILSSFAIATFILRSLTGGGGGGGSPFSPIQQANTGGSGGLSALGQGIVQTVYPVPMQQKVPRNTLIVVTFREPLDPASICASVANGKCAAGSSLLTNNIQIYAIDDATKQPVGLSSSGTGKIALAAATVASTDNKTFVISPAAYLGSATADTWYQVNLTANLKKADGSAAFSFGGNFEWPFQVSSLLDLTPPQVLPSDQGGIFPSVDNVQDLSGTTAAAKAATGQIQFVATPRVQVNESIKVSIKAGQTKASVAGTNSCADGSLTVAIGNDNVAADVSYTQAGLVSPQQGQIVNNQLLLGSCNLTLNIDSGHQAGDAWQIDIVSAKSADTLTIGAQVYTFVASGSVVQANQLKSDLSNIETAISGLVSANLSGKVLTLTAMTRGIAGNNIDIETSGSYAKLTPMSGGSDQTVVMTVKDKPDQPKNAIIQINFDKPVNPITLAGTSADVATAIRVLGSGGKAIAGQFIVSNEYKTVEFLPDNQCGVNACGAPVYCLPENSNIKVELSAAGLADCGTDNCAARSPYTDCVGKICQTATGINYPASSQPLTGVADMAGNSLDGNRDGEAQGPASYYNENSSAGAGDNYSWSFWTSDHTDLSAPTIISKSTANLGNGLADPINITFSKLMMAASLTSGQVNLFDGQSTTTHQLLNIWAKDNSPVGYWVTSAIDQSVKLDRTIASLNHSLFADGAIYRAQAGSGVKDIYQNCFKPCAAGDCAATPDKPSCCNGTPTAGGSCQ